MLTEKEISVGRWWNRAWSLVEGCTPVSEGCRNCWLRAMDRRFHRGGQVRFREDRLELPLKVKRPTVWAIWSDLFHEKVSNHELDRAFAMMGKCEQHTFMLLTKRPERMVDYILMAMC
ncbi:MAG: DUF5131 family protein, partial [Dehalococcoidales bacterium]|nr:DUF5131 family protein [Dehalococcoidales bacterium]